MQSHRLSIFLLSSPIMPAYNLSQAFLTLCNPNDPKVKDFWLWPVFNEITGSYTPPFDHLSLQNPNTNLTPSLVEATMAFSRKYWTMNETQRAKFISRKGSDQDFIGRQTWKTSVSKNAQIWKLDKRIMAILREDGRDPITIMGDDRSREVREMFYNKKNTSRN